MAEPHHIQRRWPTKQVRKQRNAEIELAIWVSTLAHLGGLAPFAVRTEQRLLAPLVLPSFLRRRPQAGACSKRSAPRGVNPNEALAEPVALGAACFHDYLSRWAASSFDLKIESTSRAQPVVNRASTLSWSLQARLSDSFG